MKTKFKLAVNSPCSEKFENFKETASGGFCTSCSKEVIDFTSMTDQQIVDYFEKQNENTCGKFNESQLKTYSSYITSQQRKPYGISGLLALSLVSLLATTPAVAQEKKPKIKVWSPVKKQKVDTLKLSSLKGKIITGNISDIDGPLPGVSVLIKGTTTGTDTDFDGNFKLGNLKTGNILVFSYLGYETQEIPVKGSISPLKIIMKEGGDILSCIVVGEVQVEKLFKSKKSFLKRKKE